jgi:hypothetical protein
MAEPHEVSHGDIYHKLGALEGKLDAVMVSVGEKRSDLADAFKRISELEKRPDPAGMIKELGEVKTRVAQGAILLAAVALLAPLLWHSLAPRVHFQPTPSAIASPR